MAVNLMRSLHALAQPKRWWVLPAGAATGLAAVGWLTMVGGLSGRLPITDVDGDYVLGILWAGVIFLVLAALPVGEKRHVLVLWIVKAAVVAFPMLIYESHYLSLDTFGYYRQAISGQPPAPGIGLGSSTDNIAFLTWLISLITGPSYRAMAMVYSLVGFAGVYLIYRSAILYTGRRTPALLYLLALFPSILFWSSILGKDPVVLLGLGLSSLGWTTLEKRKGSRAGLMLAISGMAVLAIIRPWMAAVALVPLAILPLPRTRSRRTGTRLLYPPVILLAAGLLVSYLSFRFRIIGPEDLLGLANSFSSTGWAGGSYQSLPHFTRITDILLFLPLGMFTALFRPLPWDAHNFFALLVSLENLVLVGWASLAVTRFRWSRLRIPAILALLAFIVVWAALYSLISYQNLGAAARFKLQVLPFLLLMLVTLIPKRAAQTLGASPSSIPEPLPNPTGTPG